MSRKHRRETQQIDHHHPAALPIAPLPEASEPVKHEQIEPNRFVQCPSCWGTQRGKGLVKNGPRGKYIEVNDITFSKRGKRYMRCDKCAHNWICFVEITVTSVEHRTV